MANNFSLKSLATMLHFSFFTIILFYLSNLNANSHVVNNGFSVELIHRDSLKSPFYQPKETKFKRVFNAVRRSINRVNYFNKKLFPTTNTHVSTLIPDHGGYLMSYSVGTPPFKVYGLMDTGSNLVWLQCKPCDICYNQTSPIFNPSKSSSYKNIHCSTKICKSVEHTSCSYNEDACKYTYGYGDGSKSQGDLSVETLTLESTSGSSVSFPKILIGCGHNNSLSLNGQTSGVIGFGSGPISLIKQLESSIDGKFSYCLIPFYVDNPIVSNFSSKLNFGDAAIVSGDNVVSTPIVKLTGINKGYYFVTLEAFSVGDKRINFAGGFKSEGTHTSSTQNILIDSGATVTALPNEFHTTLESVVAEVVKLERVDDPSHFFSLCYNTTTKQTNFPVITSHFRSADVKLDSNGTFVPIDEGIVCFAFIPAPNGYASFGNLVQQNLLVGYDLKKNIISFKPTDCTKH